MQSTRVAINVIILLMLHDLFILLTITNQSSDFHDPPEVASKKYPCHNMTGKQNVVVDRKHILCLF